MTSARHQVFWFVLLPAIALLSLFPPTRWGTDRQRQQLANTKARGADDLTNHAFLFGASVWRVSGDWEWDASRGQSVPPATFALERTIVIPELALEYGVAPSLAGLAQVFVSRRRQLPRAPGQPLAEGRRSVYAGGLALLAVVSVAVVGAQRSLHNRAVAPLSPPVLLSAAAPDASSSADALAADLDAVRQLEVNRPQSGAELVPSPEHGRWQLTVENGNAVDAVLALFAGTRLARAVYVRAHESTTLRRIKVGHYDARFVSGEFWNGRTFLVNPAYLAFEEPLIFDEPITAGGVARQRFTITLHDVPSGNAGTRRIDAFEVSVAAHATP